MLLVFNLFDYLKITPIFINHWWDSKSFTLFREWFCEEKYLTSTLPSDLTLEECCKGDNYPCSEMKNQAQENMAIYATFFLIMNFVWGLMFLVTQIVTSIMLVKIISAPIVQKSKERYMPFWLIIPTSVCFFIGFNLSALSETDTDTGPSFNLWTAMTG